MSHFQTFLVPYDFSEHARAALLTATDLAKRLDAKLHLVHVVQPPMYVYGYAPHLGDTPPVGGAALPELSELIEGAERGLLEAAGSVGDLPGKIETHVVEAGRVDVGIHECAKELGADLIVMGTHGRTGLAHVFLGSVAERTLRSALCPVLTVQAPNDEDEDG